MLTYVLPLSPSHPPWAFRQVKHTWERHASGLAQLMGRQGVTLAPCQVSPPATNQALDQGLAASFPPLLSPQPRVRQSLPDKETSLST